MGGKGSGKSTKPRAISRRFRPSFLNDLDGRYPVARGLKYRYGCYTSDLGGMANLSAMELTMVKRIVHLEHLVEQKESSLLCGGTIDVHAYLSAVNTLSGLLSKIGLRRRAKMLSLKDYLSNKPEPHPAPQPKEETDGNQSDHRSP